MTIELHDPHQAIFRALPQPGAVCRIVRDAHGAPVDLEIVSVTDAGAAVTGHTADELTGRLLNAFSGPELTRPILAIAARVASTGESRSFQTPTPDGHWFDATISRVGEDLVLILAVDMSLLREAESARAVAEQARRDAEERYQRAMAVVKDGVVIHDLDGRIVGANAAAAETLGITIDALTGLTSFDPRWEARHPDGRPMPGDEHPAIVTLRTGRPSRDELMNVVHPDGRRIWLLVTAEPLHDTAGAMAGAVVSFTDVTEQMVTGEELEAVRGRYQSTLQQMRERDQALRRQAGELELARSIAGLGFWRTDLRTGTTTWTTELFAMGGLPATADGVVTPQVLGIAFDERAAAERDRLVAIAIATGGSWTQELRIRHADGTDRWILVNGTIERDAEGNPLAAIGTAMDITARKLDELALRASEEALRRRTDELEEARRIAGLGTWRVDGRDDSTVWSMELYRIARLDPDGPPLRPSEIDALSDPEVVAERQRMVVESAFSGEPFEQEYELHLPGGDHPWFWIRGVGELDEHGVPFGASGIAMDITTRKRTELALRASQEALQQRTAELEEARRLAQLGVWRLDLGTMRATWSDELAEVFGATSFELSPGPDALDAMLGPGGTRRLTVATEASARTGEPWLLELEVERPDGQSRWIQARGLAEVDGDGTIVAVHGTSMDITERKRAEIALQASEERFRRVLDNLVEGAEILDREWRIVYLNRGFVRVPGYDPAADIGRSLLEVLPGFESTEIFRRFRRCMEERVPDRFEGSFQEPGQQEEWWEFSVQPVPEGIFVLALNISARHLAEVAMRERDTLLREHAERLEEAGRLARLGTWHLDATTERSSWSAEVFDILGVDPADGALDRAGMDHLVSAEGLAQRDMVVPPSLAAGVPWEVELEIRRPDGEMRWVHLRGTAERDADGRVTGHRGTIQDITERKRTEADLRRFSEALEQRVRERTAELEAANEELRSFSYTVSHDLRSPVRAVAGFARILERDLGEQLDANALHKLHNIRTAGEAMGRLIDDLLAYTRVGRAAVRHEPVPVAAIARRLAATFAARVEDRGGVIELVEPMATPLADPTLVEELLINLVDNALNYARPDVPPWVRIAAACEGGQVRLSVSDNGVGIPPEMRERVFEVFTRLDGEAEHQGTGIGLAIVRKAARSMGTDVSVESVVGEGTTFSVLLPCCGSGCRDAR